MQSTSYQCTGPEEKHHTIHKEIPATRFLRTPFTLYLPRCLFLPINNPGATENNKDK